MKPLKILACSDLHGSRDALRMLANAVQGSDYDLVVICGDFTTFGSTEYTEDVLRSIPAKVLAVPGNCDIPETVTVLEEAGASIHNARVELFGWTFFGFGGAPPSGSGMPFEVAEDIMERSLRSVAVRRGVMVTHMPPYGINDQARTGAHHGSWGVLRVATEFEPVLALSGHIHEARGRANAKNTVFVNPGPAKDGFYASITLGEGVDVELRAAQAKHR